MKKTTGAPGPRIVLYRIAMYRIAGFIDTDGI